jgi:diadenosine tetraphosphate (Ap4A) HIT family hydrolase
MPTSPTPDTGPAAGFVVDPQIDNDTYEIGRLDLSRVLLMNDARFPWLILVPERQGSAELIDLSTADQTQLWAEITQASTALKEVYAPDKLNVAALGNMVRQLHVHVIARFTSDAAWPKPVWGSGQPIPYEPHQMGIISGRLAKALGLDQD